MSGNQKPSIGRVVHYVLPADSKRAGEHRAAIMTSAFGGENQNLTVLLDQSDDTGLGDFLWIKRAWSAPYDATGTRPGSWHWPERVE